MGAHLAVHARLPVLCVRRLMTIVTPAKAGVQAVKPGQYKETRHPGYRLEFTPLKTGAGMTALQM